MSAESPKSDKFETRFSTPASELDDHRPQFAAMHRENGGNANLSPTNPGTRRPTLVNNTNVETAPDLAAANKLLAPDMVTRDFGDSAVVDDYEGELSPGTWARRESGLSPNTARRNTFRRPRDVDFDQTSRRSRVSVASSKSSSPPNSVDAFADNRRRGRAGTVTSKAASDLDLALHRTISGGTHGRRPTFSVEDRPPRTATDIQSVHSSVEDDICYPSRETFKTFKIDYEELEEFVAEYDPKAQTPIPPKCGRKMSDASRQSRPRVFDDLRRHQQQQQVPKIITPDSVLDEKDFGEFDRADDKASLKSLRSAMPPNRWTFFSSDMEDLIFASTLDGLLMPGESFRDLFEPSPDTGVWWLDMQNPTEEEVHAICGAFGVHPLTREDICTQEAREKVELFEQYYFVSFRSFYQMDKDHEDYLDPVNVYIVAFREGLLTFSFEANPHAANVRRRIGRLRDHMALSSDWLCYALIDDIVDTFGPVIGDVEQITEMIEDEVYRVRELDENATILKAVGDTRKKIIILLRLLNGKADVIKGFAKRCNEKFENAPRADVGLYLSDIQDHVVTMLSNLGHFEKMLSRGHTNYLTMIQMHSMSQGNRINETLGKVTVIATVLVPLNLVCGLFGMNVPVPGMDSGSLAWFFGILGVILAFVLGALVFAKKKKLV